MNLEEKKATALPACSPRGFSGPATDTEGEQACWQHQVLLEDGEVCPGTESWHERQRRRKLRWQHSVLDTCGHQERLFAILEALERDLVSLAPTLMPAQPLKQQPWKRQREVRLPPPVSLRGAAQTDSFQARLAPAALASPFLGLSPQTALSFGCLFSRELRTDFCPPYTQPPAVAYGGCTLWRTAAGRCFSSLVAASGSLDILRAGLRRPKERKREPSLAGQDYRGLGSWTRQGKDSPACALLPVCEAVRPHLSSQ